MGDTFSIPDAITDFFGAMNDILKFFVKLFDFALAILVKLEERKEVILQLIFNVIDIGFIIFDRIVDNLGNILANVDAFLEFIDVIFEFGAQYLQSIGEFILIIPKFFFNMLELGVKFLDIMNIVFVFVPALIIFFLVTYMINRIEDKIK